MAHRPTTYQLAIGCGAAPTKHDERALVTSGRKASSASLGSPGMGGRVQCDADGNCRHWTYPIYGPRVPPQPRPGIGLQPGTWMDRRNAMAMPGFGEPGVRYPLEPAYPRPDATPSKAEMVAAAATGRKVSSASFGVGAYGNMRRIHGMAELPIPAYAGWGRQERGMGRGAGQPIRPYPQRPSCVAQCDWLCDLLTGGPQGWAYCFDKCQRACQSLATPGGGKGGPIPTSPKAVMATPAVPKTTRTEARRGRLAQLRRGLGAPVARTGSSCGPGIG